MKKAKDEAKPVGKLHMYGRGDVDYWEMVIAYSIEDARLLFGGDLTAEDAVKLCGEMEPEELEEWLENQNEVECLDHSDGDLLQVTWVKERDKEFTTKKAKAWASVVDKEGYHQSRTQREWITLLGRGDFAVGYADGCGPCLCSGGAVLYRFRWGTRGDATLIKKTKKRSA